MKIVVARTSGLVVLCLVFGAVGCDCSGDRIPMAGADGGRGDGEAGGDGDVEVDGGEEDSGAGDAGCVPVDETCEGSDEDCDGLVDESLLELCGTDVGTCVAGVITCSAGEWTDCTGETPPSTELCDGLDNDCDGSIDEGCSCADGATQPCGSDVGDCTMGTQTCAGGMWGACAGEIGPIDELCNARDDDCDGETDELFPTLDVDCDGGDADLCAEGAFGCSPDGTGVVCDDTSPDNPEGCNGMDDDCDGTTDEGCTCTDGTTQACGSDVGACAMGTQTCAGGVWGACTGEIGPVTELCNGMDDDCDGTDDDGFALGGACDGPDADACVEGTTVCAAGGSGTTCNDATGDSVETCNGMDDDCDGTIDEGLGAGVSCDGPDADMCNEGTTVCDATGGISCDDATGDSVETCDGTDQDCDGTIDEGVPMGARCDGPDLDMCNEGNLVCMGGGFTCNDATGDSVETCNGMDDDCDGTIDDGFMLGVPCDGPDLDMCNEGVTVCAAGGGGTTCNDATGTSVETCNGMDDDCDGTIDEGNPGGGVACAGGGADVGACVSRTACVGGALICRGTFVSPAGSNTNPGTRALPLASVQAAIVNAGLIGGGADVCVCDQSTAGPSVFTENVTMVEGTSVLGAYDCSTWTRPGGRETAIQDTDADGVTFPAGITGITGMEQMTVDGFDMAGAGATTAAITITDSSPGLGGLTVRAGSAANAIGLRVIETAGDASPTVERGTYTAAGIGGGTAIAVWLQGSSPFIVNSTIGGGAFAGMALPATSYGIHCEGCTGTRLMGPTMSVNGGVATTNAYGLYGTGDMGMFTATGVAFNGGGTTGAGSSSFGVSLERCANAPSFTTSTTYGGGSAGGPVVGTRTGFSAAGSTCNPIVDLGSHNGCEAGGLTCIGAVCDVAPCTITNSRAIRGSSGPVGTVYGMRCLSGGCTSIADNNIDAGVLAAAGRVGIGMEVDSSSPLVDDNNIVGPGGGSLMMIGLGAYHGLRLVRTSSVITNNVIRTGAHVALSHGIHFELIALGPVAFNPNIHSNTIEYASSTASGDRHGVTIVDTTGGMAAPTGIMRNNIVRHVGIGGVNTLVHESGATSDFLVFENNALWDPTAFHVYYDENAMDATTGAMIDAATGGTMNQVVDCMANATWHIPAGSACRDTGTATGAPAHDFDDQGRPAGPAPARFDIGADEFVP